MRACLRCGTQNLDAATSCAACGSVFEAAATQPAPGGGLKRTMLGIARGSPPPAEPGSAAPAPEPSAGGAASPEQRLGRAGTMIGLQSPFATQPPSSPSASPEAPPPARAGGLKQTMLGFAPPGPPGQPIEGQRAPLPPGAPAASAAAAHPYLGGTLVHERPAEPSNAPRASPQEPSPPLAVRSPMHQQTMLGVALPDIEPLHAGKARPEPAPPRAAAPKAAAAARPQPSPEPLAELLVPRRTGLPRGAIVLIAVSAVLAVTAGVVAFLWESPRPIRAEVTLDERGSEVLALVCDDCVDGTIVSTSTSRATFASKKAQLGLTKPLEIGKNEIVVAVHRPGIGRDEEDGLTVAIDYRVRG